MDHRHALAVQLELELHVDLVWEDRAWRKRFCQDRRRRVDRCRRDDIDRGGGREHQERRAEDEHGPLETPATSFHLLAPLSMGWCSAAHDARNAPPRRLRWPLASPHGAALLPRGVLGHLTPPRR